MATDGEAGWGPGCTQTLQAPLAAARITGRAASIAEIVKLEKVSYPFRESFSEELDLPALKEARLTGEWSVLGTLRRTDPQAFSYWVKAQDLMNQSPM